MRDVALKFLLASYYENVWDSQASRLSLRAQLWKNFYSPFVAFEHEEKCKISLDNGMLFFAQVPFLECRGSHIFAIGAPTLDTRKAQGKSRSPSPSPAGGGYVSTIGSCCASIWHKSMHSTPLYRRSRIGCRAHTRPDRERAQLLTSIPGVSDTVANVIVAEIGIDMTRFPSAGHLVSRAGVGPRNDESAGKRRSTRLRKGAPWLKTTIVQAAWGAAKTKKSRSLVKEPPEVG